ncbi:MULTISPECIES: hypothetical protein [unclassified Paenibacillus]|uniref:hypothetical protein n=1 Tax=unclassified Paenibacillus TaxID=185978 RepID=UPI0025A16056|nr:hypothetical protein [Paenibacillus sp. S-12]
MSNQESYAVASDAAYTPIDPRHVNDWAKGPERGGTSRYCNCFLFPLHFSVWLLRIVPQVKPAGDPAI